MVTTTGAASGSVKWINKMTMDMKQAALESIHYTKTLALYHLSKEVKNGGGYIIDARGVAYSNFSIKNWTAAVRQTNSSVRVNFWNPTRNRKKDGTEIGERYVKWIVGEPYRSPQLTKQDMAQFRKNMKKDVEKSIKAAFKEKRK